MISELRDALVVLRDAPGRTNDRLDLHENKTKDEKEKRVRFRVNPPGVDPGLTLLISELRNALVVLSDAPGVTHHRLDLHGEKDEGQEREKG